MRFIDTIIRLEHVPRDSLTGVAIEICIKNLEYSDEAGLDPSSTSLDPSQSTKGYVVSAFTTKRFYLEGVTFCTDEFPSRARTFSRSIITTSRGSTPDSKVTSFIRMTVNVNKDESVEKNFCEIFFATEFGWPIFFCTNIARSKHTDSSSREFYQ